MRCIAMVLSLLILTLLALEAAPLPLPSESCSNKGSLSCQYYGSHNDPKHKGSFGTFQRKRNYTVAGVSGYISGDELNKTCGNSIDEFMSWYCGMPHSYFFESTNSQYRPCVHDTGFKYLPPHDAYSSCLCAEKSGVTASDWYSSIVTCELDLFKEILFPVECVYDSSTECNYVLEWTNNPNGPAKNCKNGYTICNPINFYERYITPAPSKCVCFCDKSIKNSGSAHSGLIPFEGNQTAAEEEGITTSSVFSSTTTITSTTSNNEITSSKPQWPDHKEVTKFEWVIIAICIFLFIIILATFIIVICLCYNGKIRKNPVSGYTHEYKSYRKRNLIALFLHVTYRESFNGPKNTDTWKIIIGGSKEPTDTIAAAVTSNDFKVKVKDGKTVWRWMIDSNAKICFKKCYGNSKKLKIPWNRIEKKFSRVDTVHKIDVIVLDEDYIHKKTVEIFKNERTTSNGVVTRSTGGTNTLFSRLEKSAQKRVRAQLTRIHGNIDATYSDDSTATEKIRNVMNLLNIKVLAPAG